MPMMMMIMMMMMMMMMIRSKETLIPPRLRPAAPVGK